MQKDQKSCVEYTNIGQCDMAMLDLSQPVVFLFSDTLTDTENDNFTVDQAFGFFFNIPFFWLPCVMLEFVKERVANSLKQFSIGILPKDKDFIAKF